MCHYNYFKAIVGGKISHLKFCNNTAIEKENLNWKVIASATFSLKKSHVTKRHVDVIKVVWKKDKASTSAENVYETTANIQASGKDD